MRNRLFATTFSVNRPQRKLVTYYLTCFDKHVQELNQSGREQTVQMGGM